MCVANSDKEETCGRNMRRELAFLLLSVFGSNKKNNKLRKKTNYVDVNTTQREILSYALLSALDQQYIVKTFSPVI
jgi:hypothetical protein